MLQFYFLSILLNILAGLIMVYATDFMKKSSSLQPSESDIGESVNAGMDIQSDDESENEGDEDDSIFDKKIEFALNSKGTFFDDMTFRLVVAILSGLVGLMKLLSTVQEDVPIIGDLIPAIAGMSACFALLIEFYTQKSSVSFNLPEVLTSIFVGGRKYLGIFCIIAGVLHFIFPRVLFL